MAKLIDYDVSGVEDSGGGGSVQPTPSVYPAKIVRATQRDQKVDGTPANDIEVILDLGGDYVWLWSYIGLGEASDWKLAEFIRALNLKDKGKLNLDKIAGTLVRVKVNPDSRDGEYTARAGRLMKALEGDELPEASDNGSGPSAEAEDGPVDDEASAAADGDFVPSREGEELGSYDDWGDDDLQGEVEDRDLTVAGGRGKKRDKWIKALRDDDTEAAEAGDEPGEPQQEDNYDELDVEQLEQEFTDRELDKPDKPRGRNAEARYMKALVDALRADDEEFSFDPEAS